MCIGFHVAFTQKWIVQFDLLLLLVLLLCRRLYRWTASFSIKSFENFLNSGCSVQKQSVSRCLCCFVLNIVYSLMERWNKCFDKLRTHAYICVHEQLVSFDIYQSHSTTTTFAKTSKPKKSSFWPKNFQIFLLYFMYSIWMTAMAFSLFHSTYDFYIFIYILRFVSCFFISLLAFSTTILCCVAFNITSI